MLIRGILFDFDGTLTMPGSLDFAALKRVIGCPRDCPVLEFIDCLSSEAEKREALRILDEFEAEAAFKSQPNHGAEGLLRFIRSRGLKAGIVSRNRLVSILRALDNFKETRASHFAVILSRDDPFFPKPSPEGISAAAERMQVPMENLLMVGDYLFDIQAACNAGVCAVYLSNGAGDPATSDLADFTIHHLSELRDILHLHTALPAGKLPNDLLANFLNELGLNKADLLIPPGVGEDAAALELNTGLALILKSDPVTFATDSIGYYSVVVNANDIATSGALPRWLLTTLLFPLGTTAAQVHEVMVELHQVAIEHGMRICGGHTEITDAVCRPVVVAQAIGTVATSGLLSKGNMKTGDQVVMTKGIAIEGTSILAREFPGLLRNRGVNEETLEKCRGFLHEPGIAILKEASCAAMTGAVTAMHDVTEGGLATALEELSAAGRHRIRIYLNRIPILGETRHICSLLDIDPLGLIGSGSLLITCAAEKVAEVIEAICQAGVAAVRIGEVLDPGCGIEALSEENGIGIPWPRFEVDEIARVFRRYAQANARFADPAVPRE
jgi:hydrogenase expression/formation protein HypE